jgi:hypothetical protein
MVLPIQGKTLCQINVTNTRGCAYLLIDFLICYSIVTLEAVQQQCHIPDYTAYWQQQESQCDIKLGYVALVKYAVSDTNIPYCVYRKNKRNEKKLLYPWHFPSTAME